MAIPGKDSDDIKVRLTKVGMQAVSDEAEALHIEKVEVLRVALKEYFQKRGKAIEFTPKHGGSRKRESEGDTVRLVLSRVQALGLPPPATEYKLGHKLYDLAWPERRVAIEVAKRQRPADRNGWNVGHIKPTDSSSTIDEVLKGLLLT